ncbi:hypothetical protein [Epilithonimonas mollis]|uniref:hypothetical protein n=1 Tax=Epilithonimonas mollis TaxID=216903 RepID=UPI001587DB15|nr:hypothetical protein [Epilithonimonas mollis]
MKLCYFGHVFLWVKVKLLLTAAAGIERAQAQRAVWKKRHWEKFGFFPDGTPA